MPVRLSDKGTEIDDATLQSIKAEVEMLEIGEIRYDSVQSSGYDYYIIDPDTGRHIVEKRKIETLLWR